jgi:hypothetical protein
MNYFTPIYSYALLWKLQAFKILHKMFEHHGASYTYAAEDGSCTDYIVMRQKLTN